MATMPGSNKDSSWKWTRAATISLENSRGACVPARMGAVKRGQRDVQACCSEGRVRDAERAKASCTAPVNRFHSSVVSCIVVVGSGVLGSEVVLRIVTNSVLV